MLNTATFLPETLRYGTASGASTWTFTNYKAFHGRMLPTHIVHRSETQGDRIEIVSAERVKFEAPYYKRPKSDAAKADFESSADSAVEIKQVMGLMFVHPKERANAFSPPL